MIFKSFDKGLILIVAITISSFFFYIPNTLASDTEWLNGWSYRKKITIDKTNIDENLADFPLYVKIYDDKEIGSNSQDDGDDIRFTSSNGTTTLAFDLEKWTGGDGASTTADFWVKIPILETATNTEMYIYYGSTTASSAEQATTTWSNGYLGVYHFAENSSTKDVENSASTTAYAGTAIRNTDLMASTSGQVDGAFNMNSIGDYVSLGDINEIDNTSQITYEAWVNPTSLANWRAVITKQVGSTYTTYSTMQLTGVEGDGGANDVIVCVSNGSQSCGHTASANIISPYVMHHWTMVFDGTLSGSSNRLKFYLDGIQKSLTFIGAAVPATSASTAASVYIGNAGADSLFFPGIIDEVRISNTARSDAWINFGVNNMSSLTNEITFGNQEDQTPPTTPDLSATINSSSAITLTSSTPTDSTGLHATPYQFREVSGRSGGSSSDWQASNIFIDNDLSCGTEYSYQVRAKDSLGNISEYSPIVSANTSGCSSGGGNSIQSQVRNLEAMGNIAMAEDLKKKWPHLFANPTPIPVVPISDKEILVVKKATTSEIKQVFERNLKPGMTGEDVKHLQIFLNKKGYTLSSSGPGSVGMETDFFGTLTYKALIKFQQDNNIIPAIGWFGPITRKFVNGQD